MRGKNTTAMKSPRLLRAFFSKLALSSPPERFLQIPVWGIVNTNFSLLKSPHIPAMLSFEWRTQGRPLNSFIVGFKTLHFKKYKSYSQMNEGERGDWREGLLMCPVGRHEPSLSPRAAQIHSPVRLPLCPSDPALHTWRPYFNFLQNTHSHANTTPDNRSYCCACHWEMPRPLTPAPNETLRCPLLISLHYILIAFRRRARMIDFSCWAPMRLTFLCFQTPLGEKCFLCGQSVSINLAPRPGWNDTVLIKPVISCLPRVDDDNQRFDAKW